MKREYDDGAWRGNRIEKAEINSGHRKKMKKLLVYMFCFCESIASSAISFIKV